MSDTHQKKKRKGLTVEKIFEKKKYVNILTLIIGNQKKKTGIKRSQLIKTLVAGYQSPKTDFPYMIPENEKFKSILGLRNYLTQLKKLDLITSVKPGKHYYYVPTEYGFRVYYKWSINFKINNLINDTKSLEKINESLLSYIKKEARKIISSR